MLFIKECEIYDVQLIMYEPFGRVMVVPVKGAKIDPVHKFHIMSDEAPITCNHFEELFNDNFAFLRMGGVGRVLSHGDICHDDLEHIHIRHVIVHSVKGAIPERVVVGDLSGHIFIARAIVNEVKLNG